jgi:hypothetical protein
VCDDFVAVQLEDGAGCAFARGWVVYGGHAAFECEQAGAERGRVCLALEGSGGCAV